MSENAKLWFTATLVALMTVPLPVVGQGAPGMSGTTVGPSAIDTEAKAKQAAANWLAAVGGHGLKVGKVTEIGEIFVVDVLFAQPQDALRDQLIIRKPDGYTFPVFPRAAPRPPAMGGMSGMHGMGGMSGMQGMGGMSGMQGMGGMSGMQGMGGMSGMQGMGGMSGMQGMSGMSGMQGKPGASEKEKKAKTK